MDCTELDHWLDRAKSWGDPGGVISLEGLRNTCKCLGELSTFLRQLHVAMTTWERPADILRHLPNIGQFLGRLCHNPAVVAYDDTCSSLHSCLTALCTDCPQEDVERRAASWAQKMLRHLVTGSPKNSVPSAMGYLPADHSKLALEKLIEALSKDLDRLQQDTRLKARQPQPNVLHQLSELCLPLVSMSTAAPVIERLLLAGLEGRTGEDGLTVLFLESVGRTRQQMYTNKGGIAHVSLSPAALCALWTLHAPCLEQEVLHLAETATLHRPHLGGEDLKTLICSSGLPAACARQPRVNAVTREIFRKLVEESSAAPAILKLLRAFNECFILDMYKMQIKVPRILQETYTVQQLPLVHMLILHPADLLAPTCSQHLRNICRALREMQGVQAVGCQESWTQVSQAGPFHRVAGISCTLDSWLLLVQFGWWYHEACRLLLLTPVPPDSCLQYLACYHLPVSPQQQQGFMTCIHDVACTLHGLLSKIHLKSHDLLYAVSSTNQQPGSLARRAVIGQLLMLFLLHSAGGQGIADEISNMVFTSVSREVAGDQNPVTRLVVLLDTIEENLVGQDGREHPSWARHNKISALLHVMDRLCVSTQEQLKSSQETDRLRLDDLKHRCDRVKQFMQSLLKPS